MYKWDRRYREAGPETRKVFLLIGSIFIIIGAIMLIVGIVMMNNTKKKTEACTGEAKATVVRLDEAHSEDSEGYSKTTYAPVVEYSVGGETYTGMSPVHTSPCKYTVGQTVIVHYDPADPNVMIIEGDNSSKFLSIFFMAMGGFFAAMGLLFEIAGIKSWRYSYQ